MADVMASLPPRDLRAEIDKHFRGTAEERVLAALRLGEESVRLFRAMSPEIPAAQVRDRLRRNKNRGRRKSSVAGCG
jgi:hypothetical protein